MKIKKRVIGLIAGWTFFLVSSAYMLYKLLRGVLLSIQFRTTYYLSSFALKEWAIPLVLFFLGVYLLYKYEEKPPFLSAVSE